jgi:hypothetical protein
MLRISAGDPELTVAAVSHRELISKSGAYPFGLCAYLLHALLLGQNAVHVVEQH